jgi:hypothetical protein
MPTPAKDKDMQALQAAHAIPPAEDIPITQVNMELFGDGECVQRVIRGAGQSSLS